MVSIPSPDLAGRPSLMDKDAALETRQPGDSVEPGERQFSVRAKVVGDPTLEERAAFLLRWLFQLSFHGPPHSSIHAGIGKWLESRAAD